MRLALSIVAALSIGAATAVAKPRAAARPNRVVPKAPAPPRVFEGILGYLKNPNLQLPPSSVPSGAGTPATTAAPAGATKPTSSNGTTTLGNPFGSGSSAAGVGAKTATTAGANNASSDDDKLAFDENNMSANADKANGAAKKGGGGNAPPEKSLRKLSTAFPVCIFIDSTQQAKANAAIKGMVDMGAECDVQIIPFPVVTNFTMGDNEAAINAEQTKACNIPEELGTDGYGSATSFVPWPETAGAMCKVPHPKFPDDKTRFDPAVAGCAQVRAARGEDGVAAAEAKANADPTSEFAKNFREQRKEFGGRSSRDKVVPSIEVPNGHTDVVLSHEALGHSQMGRPNGETMGNGIGEWGEEPKPDKSGGKGGWSKPQGCAALKANAFPNSKNFMYDEKRETYFTPQTQRIYQLGQDKPIFTRDPRAPLPAIAQGPNPATSDTPASGGGSPGGQLGGQEAIVSRPVPPSTTKPVETAAVADAAVTVKPKAGGRHETKATGGITLAELRQKNPPKEPPRDDSFAVVAQKSPGGAASPFSASSSRETLRIDESAGPNTAIAVVGSGGSKSSGANIFDASGGGGGSFASSGGGAKLGFDETMTAKGPTSTVGTASPPTLYLGKNSTGGTGPGDSALSGDFFSKVQFDSVEAERRRKTTGAARGSRGVASLDAGDEPATNSVRSLRR